MNRSRNMKKFIATATTATLVTSVLLPTAVSASEEVFKDMKKGDFGYKEITTLKANKVIDGFPDDTFRPSQLLKREEAAKLLVSGLGLKGDGKYPAFTDIGENSPWITYVDASFDGNIIKGNKDGSFGFGDYMTREQMASVIVRAFNLSPTHKAIEFSDIHSASNGHKNDILTLAQNGITFGYSNGTFKPKEKINRVNFAVFLYRALENAKVQNDLVVEGSSLTYDGQTYIFGEEFNGFFADENIPALKNAVLDIHSTDGKITKIASVQINSNSDVNFDFGGKSFNGEFHVEGKNITLRNGIVSGVISAKSNGALVFDKMQSTSTVDAQFATSLTVKESTFAKVTANTISTTAAVSNKQTMTVDSKSSIDSLTLKSNMNVEYNATSLAELILGESTTSVSFKGSVDTLTLLGTAKRTIENLSGVKNFVVPTGSYVQDLISNFTEVQKVHTPVTGGGSGGGGVVVTPPINEIDLKAPYTVEDGHVYTGNHTIVYGNNEHDHAAVFKASSAGNEVVFNGDLIVNGNGYMELENVIVNGTLTLNPGDQGGVKLTNVSATSIIVVSGAMNTTTFSDVTTTSIKVTDSNGGRIIMDGANYIDKFEIAPIKTAIAPEFKLGGTFTAPIVLTSDLILTTDSENSFSAESIEVKPTSAASEIQLAGNLGNVSEIKVSSPVTLNVAPSASVYSVDIATNSVTLKGDLTKSNIVVTQSATVTVAPDSQIGTVDINDSVDSVNITGDLSGSTDTLQVSSAEKVTVSPEEAI
ncbi:MAG: S-layer homology domain-containing protein, partial [Paenisporosarcina sp.]|nr:S-layer homology domain-containing protein [Paenisporosarcina sp.]